MAAYARVAVTRGAGFTVSGNQTVTAADNPFPVATAGSTTATHFGIGTAASGAGQLVFFGALTPNILITNAVTPNVKAGTNVNNVTPDALANAAATAMMNLYFKNIAHALVGDAAGLQPSAAAGSFYISLHTASPAEGGDQTTNEVSYT